jgi:hypothetical protein
MGWHESYLIQARSEYAVLQRLSRPGVEYCHRLHYLQMVTEKLAKAMLTAVDTATAAPTSHAMFVRMLQVLKGRPEIRRQLGYSDAGIFKAFIDSLLDLAARIERLSPDQAGLTQPNPEYPWQDRTTDQVITPAQHPFTEFDPRDPKMLKIDRLERLSLQCIMAAEASHGGVFT